MMATVLRKRNFKLNFRVCETVSQLLNNSYSTVVMFLKCIRKSHSIIPLMFACALHSPWYVCRCHCHGEAKCEVERCCRLRRSQRVSERGGDPAHQIPPPFHRYTPVSYAMPPLFNSENVSKVPPLPLRSKNGVRLV